jgi:tRNA threonylcarbamoyladenosine biosynthesis protein TsaB
MTLVLGISTSTARGSVALFGSTGLLALASHEILEAHAERLFGLIDEVLREARADRRAVCAVACDVGPGSFTGLRVGVASAAGITAALGVLGIGVGSLESMAHAALVSAPPGTERVVAMLDAKKGEVFVGAFDGAGVAREPARHIPHDRAVLEIEAAVSDTRTRFAGAMILELVPGLASELSAAGRLVRSPSADLPCASSIARVAHAWLAEKREFPPLLPVYVREPDAKPAAARA